MIDHHWLLSPSSSCSRFAKPSERERSKGCCKTSPPKLGERRRTTIKVIRLRQGYGGCSSFQLLTSLAGKFGRSEQLENYNVFRCSFGFQASFPPVKSPPARAPAEQNTRRNPSTRLGINLPCQELLRMFALRLLSLWLRKFLHIRNARRRRGRCQEQKIFVFYLRFQCPSHEAAEPANA